MLPRGARRVLLAPHRDPFKILGLTRSATKAEVKTKYRELARIYHPDASSGDGVKMEEVNQAYKLLMKEGGYERLHLDTTKMDSRAHPAASARRDNTGAPFSTDHQSAAADEEEGDGGMGGYKHGADGCLSDEEAAKLSGVDPTTERRTDDGKFLYQNRDDGTWVTLDRPIYRVQQPRYQTFSSQVNMSAELRRRAVLLERERNERSALERTIDKLSDSADLPSRDPKLLALCLVVLLVSVYQAYERTFARQNHQRKRTEFYNDIITDRVDLETSYLARKDGLDVAVVAAALIFLAASRKKTMADPVQPPVPEVYFRSVKPPPSHFNIIAGI